MAVRRKSGMARGWLALATVVALAAYWQMRRVKPGMVGFWEGKAFNQRVALEIAGTHGGYEASFDFIDSGIGWPARKLRMHGRSIQFVTVSYPLAFTGSADAGMTQITGGWRIGTNFIPVTLTRTDKPDIANAMRPADYAPRAGSDLQGTWEGVLVSGPTRNGVTLRIAEAADGKLRAEMDRVDWGGQHIAATSATHEGDAVRMAFHDFGSFNGSFDRGSGELVGHWNDGGRSDPVAFSQVDLKAEEAAKNYTAGSDSDLQGHWKGTVNQSGVKLHFTFNIARLPDGTMSSTLDSPDQGALNVQATTTVFTPTNVSIMWAGVRGVFNGALKNGKLTGTWRQRGSVHPLTLTRDGT